MVLREPDAILRPSLLGCSLRLQALSLGLHPQSASGLSLSILAGWTAALPARGGAAALGQHLYEQERCESQQEKDCNPPARVQQHGSAECTSLCKDPWQCVAPMTTLQLRESKGVHRTESRVATLEDVLCMTCLSLPGIGPELNWWLSKLEVTLCSAPASLPSSSQHQTPVGSCCTSGQCRILLQDLIFKTTGSLHSGFIGMRRPNARSRP